MVTERINLIAIDQIRLRMNIVVTLLAFLLPDKDGFLDRKRGENRSEGQ